MTTNLRLERPLVALALAGSGPDPDRAPIIELSALRLDPEGPTCHFTWRLDPGRRRVREDSPAHRKVGRILAGRRLAAVAGPLDGLLDGCDLIGFELLRSTVPTLDRAFADLGDRFEVDGRRLVDLTALLRNLPGVRPAVAAAFGDPGGADPIAAAARAYLGRSYRRDAGVEAEARLAVALLKALLDAHAGRLPAGIPALHDFIGAVDFQGFIRRVGPDLVLDVEGLPRVPIDCLAADEHGLAELKRLAACEAYPDDTRALLREAIAAAEAVPEDPPAEDEVEDLVAIEFGDAW